MLQLYGNPRSRAMRRIWMLEEVGLPYQLIEKSTRADDLQTADYLRLNPNARIPTLVDGDVALWEFMAINIHLAQKYGWPMHFANSEVLGLAAQWSFWVMLEMEGLLLDLLQHRALLPEFVRDPSCAERDELLLQKPLVPLHSDFDWLNVESKGQISSGRCLGSTSTSMLRGILGCLLMNPARSSVSTIW